MSDLSFIIPAFNEAALIANAIENIREFAPPGYSREIIVVDNGSADSTHEVAGRQPETRVLRAAGTVGAARNLGVDNSGGRLLVFLDADVRLTRQWQSEVPKAFEKLDREPRAVTGSTVGVPENPGLIERYWFEPATRQRRSYVNSGHLIVSRSLFQELGGFDPALRTGEDFDFCQRAGARGARIDDDRSLPVIHLGFPTTLGAFARRELWHGQGDVGSLSRLMRSRVALVSLFVFALSVSGPILSLLTGSLWPALATLAGAAGISLLFGVRRSGGFDPIGWLVNGFLYYVYFLCRAAAVVVRPPGWRQQRTQSDGARA